MYGGTTREDPEYPGILSIPDTVSVRWYVWREDPEFLGILSIPDTVSVRGYSVWNTMCGGLGRIPRIPGYLVFRTQCL